MAGKLLHQELTSKGINEVLTHHKDVLLPWLALSPLLSPRSFWLHTAASERRMGISLVLTMCESTSCCMQILSLCKWASRCVPQNHTQALLSWTGGHWQAAYLSSQWLSCAWSSQV